MRGLGRVQRSGNGVDVARIDDYAHRTFLAGYLDDQHQARGASDAKDVQWRHHRQVAFPLGRPEVPRAVEIRESGDRALTPYLFEG